MSETRAKNPYRQIALTYVHRQMFWISGGILILMLTFLTVRAFQNQPPQVATNATNPAIREAVAQINESRAAADVYSIIMFFFGQAWILVTILGHLKEQIASPRAVIVPNYRRPHLLVAASFAIPLLILIPLYVGAAFNLPPLAVLAMATLFSALVLWFAYLQTRPFSIILILLYFSSFSTPGRHALHAALANTVVWENVFFIALGLAAIARLAPRLMRLREEMPEYARQIASNRWQTMTMGQTPQSSGQPNNYDKPMSRFMYAGARRRLASLAAATPSSAWGRLERWRLAGNPTSLQWIIAPIFLLEILIMTRTTGAFNTQFMLIQLVGFPMMFFPQFALGTWPTLGVESLRPVTRAAYLRERGGTFALQLGQVWVILATTLVTCAALFQPVTLASARFWISLAVTALAQFPLFAVSVWVLRLRWPLATIGATSVLAGLVFAGSAWCNDSRMAPPAAWVAAVCGAVLLASVIILGDAYRRWMQTDLA